MPLDFPPTPVLNQVYSLGGKSWKWNGAAWETYNDNLGVDFVETVNGITGDVSVVGGTDISVSSSGKNLTVNYTGSSVSNVVSSFNGRTGAVQGVSAAVASTGIFVSGSTGTVTITNTGVQSFNGLTGSIQGVSSWNGQTGAVQFHNYVSSFNGATGAVAGVSAVNGVTGEFTIRSGMGITHSVSNNGISLEINYIRGGQPFPTLIGASGKALMAQDNLMLLSFKNSGASAGFMYTTRIQDFLEKFVGARVVEPLAEDPSTASFLMVGGGGEGYVDFASMPLVTSVNGKTGSIGFVAQQGITLSVSGTTTSISLNYLQGASAIATTKYPEKDDWLVLQDNGSPYSMQRTQLGNISYLFLGTQQTKGSGSFLRMVSNINSGAGTVDDEYITFTDLADELVGIIDGGTFA